MIEGFKKRGAMLRRELSQEALRQNILKAIRNRKGHRPLSADRVGGDLVVASYNIHKCVGVDNIFDPVRIVRVIRELNADILALQEADKRFGERVGLIELDYFIAETGLKPVPIAAMSPNGLGWHGNALFIKNGEVRDVLQVNLPGVEPRGALIVELDMALGPIRIIAAHFGLLRHSRNQQAKMILSLLQKRAVMPTVMVGDLNEWRVGKGSSLSNFAEFFDVPLGTVPSFPSRFPFLALDRVFAYPHDLVTSVETHKSPLARIASDHLPLKAHIDLKNAVHHLAQLNGLKDKASQAISPDQPAAK